MITINCPQWIIDRFKKQAKKAFPNETMAYLWGQIDKAECTIEGLYVPPDMDENCGHEIVYIQPNWSLDAVDDARENGAVVVGDIHTHPFTKDELSSYSYTDHTQSETDITSRGLAWQQISGICLVKETKNGKLRSSIKFWGPTIPVKTVINTVHSVHSSQDDE